MRRERVDEDRKARLAREKAQQDRGLGGNIGQVCSSMPQVNSGRSWRT